MRALYFGGVAEKPPLVLSGSLSPTLGLLGTRGGDVRVEVSKTACDTVVRVCDFEGRGIGSGDVDRKRNLCARGLRRSGNEALYRDLLGGRSCGASVFVRLTPFFLSLSIAFLCNVVVLRGHGRRVGWG